MCPFDKSSPRCIFASLISIAAGIGLFTDAAPVRAAIEPGPKTISVAELEGSLVDQNPKILAVRLEGIVLAVASKSCVLAFQDASGASLIELSIPSVDVTNGQHVVIEANPGIISRSAYGIRMENVPVADNDGLHSAATRAGTVALESGMIPIRVTWFNGPAEFALNVEYQGPDILRQRVPDGALWCRSQDATNQEKFVPGLRYRAYEKNNYKTIAWSSLPNFSRMTESVSGVATNFSVGYRTRDENCGLTFDGFIKIDHAGIYTFYLTSDDGSKLHVGLPSLKCKILAPGETSPNVGVTERNPNGAARSRWTSMEGEVTFAVQDQLSLELEMNVSGRRVPVRLIDRGDLSPADLLRSKIRIEGVSKFLADSAQTLVLVPSAAQVQASDASIERAKGLPAETLTTAMQVQRLSPANAQRHLNAAIRGVVIYANRASIVLCDFSGGVFVTSRSLRWEHQPGTGELWEIEGTTDPGLFSPVVTADKATFLDYAPMPEPVHPVWDQLMNGNLDAQYGELRGVITSVSTNEIVLLLPEGRISIVGSAERPLPEFPDAIKSEDRLIGSVVRIRGCFATMVDLQSRRVIPGKILIYPARTEVEEALPVAPFLLPAKTVQDLKWFDARGTVLQRTKLAGQVVFITAQEVFAEQGGSGFRVFVDKSMPVKVGDLVEAVGFPKLGSASPALLEAQIRVTGEAVLPDAVAVGGDQLLDRSLDSTMVTVKAVLITDTIDRNERVLHLQNGPYHFTARLKADLQETHIIRAGSELQLTGVYVWADEARGLGAMDKPFELLLHCPADIIVLRSPPWWTLRHAIVAVSALAGLLCVSFVWVVMLRRTVHQRTTQLKKEIEERRLAEQRQAIEQERIRMARDLHDELGAGLTEVGMLGSLANTETVAPEARGRYLGQLTNVARSLVVALDEIVWAVNPDYDTLPLLVSYFSLYAESLLSLAGIKCRLQVMEAVPERPLDSKLRHGLLCALKEALNNVIRHANATEVRTEFQMAGDTLIISVVDNGHGFASVPQTSDKHGLSGLKLRLQSLGGECQIISEPGRGTRVVMRIPLTPNENGKYSDR